MECGRLEKWVKTSNKHFYSNIGWHPQFLGHNPEQIFCLWFRCFLDKYSDLTLICLQWCTDRRWRDWVSRCHGWPGASPGPEVSAASWCPTLTPRSGHRARCPDLLCHITLPLTLCVTIHLCQSRSWAACICNSGLCSAAGHPPACALPPCEHWTPAACRTRGSGTVAHRFWTNSKH